MAAKIEKRQAIILGIMVLVVLYGAYDFLFGRSPKKVEVTSVRKVEDVGTILTQVVGGMKAASPSPAMVYAISRAEERWLKDPFLERRAYRDFFRTRVAVPVEGGKVLPESKKPSFKYSGYVNSGGKEIAIINGLEYTIGDSLVDAPGYVVKTIDPQKVVLENTLERERMEVPINE